MKITPIKLAKALLQARANHDIFVNDKNRREREYNYDKFPHWKKFQILGEAKIIIEALQIMKDNND